MNKKFLSFLMAGMVVFAVSTSCSSDDDDDNNGGGSSSKVQAGALAGDDAEANAAVEGVRVSAVGDYRYSYDENGKLETITSRNGWTLEAKNNFKMQWEDEYDTGEMSFSISGNRITGISIKYTLVEYGVSISGSGSASFSYNSKGQLTSISTNSSESGNVDGEKYSASAKANSKYTYSSDNRLLSFKYESSGKDDDGNFKETELVTYDYSTSYPNLFYQYTPRQIPGILFDLGADDADFDMFAYVGLLGKASSYLPSGYTAEWVYEEDGYEDDTESYTRSCSYSFNDNGTISQADGKSYSYTNVGTRAAFYEEAAQPLKKDAVRRCPWNRLFYRIHGRHKAQ
ncbi:MAG: DUF4595 domain-containing protein [Bacteroidaceae bacterium]|nr:DUF4595 domain-containing protein [Bacteroidaceae bacterium]